MLHLLRQRSFGAMTLSQFLGAFNDNAFKQVVLLLATAISTGGAADWVRGHGLGGELTGISPQAVPPFLFALPFVVFGPATGSMADRFSKTAIIKAANLMEVVVMCVGALAFVREDYGLLMLAVFLMGTQSALFGPSKYGVIKEMVGERQLAPANGLIQSSTMIAVLAGVFVGGILSEHHTDGLWRAGLWTIGFAIAGWLVSLRIAPLPAADPSRRVDWNPVRELISHWRATEGERYLVLAILASAFFYMMAATFLIVLPTYGKWMGMGDATASQLTATPGIGIVIGAFLAGRISADRIEGGLVPLGLLGMAACLLATSAAPDSIPWVSACFVGMGVCSGLFTIPIRCLIQSLPREDKRGAVQGLAEVMDFVGILAAPALFSLWDKGFGLSPAQMFVFGGAMILAFAALSLVVAGEFFVRLVLLALTHSVYRLRVHGRAAHLPEHGGALLVANHVSFADAVLIGAAAGRPVSFLMHRSYFRTPLVGWFARRMGAIPVAGGDGPEARREALAAAAERCRAGELVCIFAEGAITRTGTMLPFRRGMERVASDAGVPVLPVALDRLWGSVFSYERGRFFWKRPRRLPYPVDILFGAPLPPDTPAPAVRDQVAELIADHRATRRGRRGSLAWRFLRTSRARWRRPAVTDTTGAALTHGRLLVSTLALRRVLERRLDAEERVVGVLLPPGVAGTLANVALTLAGRVAVNLNSTLPDETLARCLVRAGARRVVTSRRYLAALGREAPGDALLLEDLRDDVRRGDRVRAALLALLPGPWLARVAAPRVDPREEVATILYSSGTCGEPKGVELTHAAVLSNVQSVLSVFPLGPDDVLLGVLPHFHSFGYTVGLWSALLGGAQVAAHADPRDGRAVGELCARAGVTVLIAPPTFYQMWMRRMPPEALASARVAVCGAERLRPELATAFEERYGVPLLEGYGCTECGPVVSFNLPDAPGLSASQRANRPGTVGRPLPGVALRVRDVETGELRPSGDEGELEVKSPALMRGYVADPERTRAVLRDGWYATGDVARVDEDGFLVLVDRLARFSKVGGEMVPHGRVEDELRDAVRRLGGEAEELVVVGRADERKGERLVVVHAGLGAEVERVVAELGQGELPPLFRPAAADFVQVTDIPRLATGKVDLAGVRRLACPGGTGS